jgi:hypothetical protein
MRRFGLAALLLVGVPSLAIAQAPSPAPAPAPDPNAPPPDPNAPPPDPNAPPPDPNAPPLDPNAPPSPAPQPAPAPQPLQPAPSPGYYQQQPVYQPPPSTTLHDGLTFEVQLGLGWIRVSPEGQDGRTSDLGLGGLSGGVGGWVNRQLAITGRIATATITGTGDSRASAVFLGPSVQYWVDPRFWLGGGAGLGFLTGTDPSGNAQDSVTGIALDIRVGYTFNEGTENTIQASLELTPGFFSENGSSATVTGIGILLGYQHL